MAATRFVDDLERQLTCPSCKEIFTDPKTLACLHSFCARCIVEDYELCSNNNQGYICPECTIITNSPEAEPTNLRSSSYVHSLLHLFHAMRSKDDNERKQRLPDCASCHKSFVNLVGFCTQCSGMICGECVNAHKTMKHKNHQVVMFQDFKQEDLDSYSKTQMLCKEKFHGKNGKRRIEYFCEEDACKCCICRRCFLLDHRKHSLLYMEEMEQQLHEATKEDMAKLDQLAEKLGEDLEKSKQNISRIENEIKVAKQKVHNAVETVVKKAKDHEDSMIKALDKRLLDLQKANSLEQNDIKDRTKQIQEFRLRCQTMIEKNACELVRIQKDLKQICQTFFDRRPSELPCEDIKRNVTVHYVTNYVVCQSVKDMGKIVESVTDQSHCSIESLKEARYEFVNDLDYVTRSSKGDMSMATRWKRTFLWSKFKSSFDSGTPGRMIRAMSVS